MMPMRRWWAKYFLLLDADVPLITIFAAADSRCRCDDATLRHSADDTSCQLIWFSPMWCDDYAGRADDIDGALFLRRCQPADSRRLRDWCIFFDTDAWFLYAADADYASRWCRLLMWKMRCISMMRLFFWWPIHFRRLMRYADVDYRWADDVDVTFCRNIFFLDFQLMYRCGWLRRGRAVRHFSTFRLFLFDYDGQT